MLKIITSTITLIIITLSVNAGIKSNISYHIFSDLSRNKTLEIFTSIDENSLVYKLNKESKYSARALMSINIKKRPDSSLLNYFPYKNLSFFINSTIDSLQAKKTSVYGIKKIPLVPGFYKLTITLKDDYLKNKKAFKVTQSITIEEKSSDPSFSDIMPLSSYFKSTEESEFTKNGNFIIPYSYNFYSEQFKKLLFYLEIYPNNQLMSGKEYEFQYYIANSADSKKLPAFYNSEMIKTNQIKKGVYTINIDSLPTGNYLLVTRLVKEKIVINEREFFFQKKNNELSNIKKGKEDLTKFLNTTSFIDMNIYLKMLIPISKNSEQKIINWLDKSKDLPKMQSFFINFWNSHSDSPYTAWKNHFEAAKKADRLFSTPIKKGFLTDRGKVYLKYGKPNTVSSFKNEQNAYPYEIWHYYKAKNLSNAKFVFYNKNNSTNDYLMLHSNVPGEIRNTQWRAALHSRTNQIYNHDQTDIRDYEGDRSKDFFENPR